VYVTFPAGVTTLTGPRPAETLSMTLDSYTKYTTGNPTYPILTGGEITVNVGGTLHVPNTVTVGEYRGTFDVTVGYY
jgi:hypothetical protein